MSYNSILATTPLVSTNYHLKATGTTIGNSLIWDNGTNVGIGNTNTSYTLDVSGTGRFTGQLYANAKLEVNDTNGIPLRFQDISAAITGQTAGYIGMSTSAFSGNNGDLVLYPRTSATSKILLMGGNVGIGTSTVPAKLTIYTGLGGAFPATSGTTQSNGLVARYKDTSNACIDYGTNGGSGGWLQVTNITDLSSAYPFLINPNGGNLLIGTTTDRSFKLVVEGTDNNNLMGSYNTTSGASLRMQSNQTINYLVSATNPLQVQVGSAIAAAIYTNGNMTIGTNIVDSGFKFYMRSTAGMYLETGSSSSNTSFQINDVTGGNVYFKVRGDGYLQSPTTYNNTTATGANLSISTSGFIERSTSSIRFKTNVEDLYEDTSSLLYKMRPIWYRSLGYTDRKDWSWYGFIAEELAEIEPRLIHWGYDISSYEEIEIIDEEGNTKQERKLKEDAVLIPDGVQYERITVLLVAEMQKINKLVQEQQAQIQSLQEQINILAK